MQLKPRPPIKKKKIWRGVQVELNVLNVQLRCMKWNVGRARLEQVRSLFSFLLFLLLLVSLSLALSLSLPLSSVCCLYQGRRQGLDMDGYELRLTLGL